MEHLRRRRGSLGRCRRRISAEVTIPGMAADLEAVYAAWQDGSLERTRSWMEKMTLRAGGVVRWWCWWGRDLEAQAGEEMIVSCCCCDATRWCVMAPRREGGYSMATKKAVKKSIKSNIEEEHLQEGESTRKYGPTVGKDVEREMKAMKQGKLKSGRSGKTVTNPKQAIAIGLSEARKEGKKVPPPKKDRNDGS